jgi:hypothetical protein
VNKNSPLPQNFPTVFAILSVLLLIPNSLSLSLYFSVCSFLWSFYAFFFHLKKVAAADVGLHLFSVKRFLYSLNYSSSITSLRRISWSVNENYVCWYSSLCFQPQQILWPRDVGNTPGSRLAHSVMKLHFWPAALFYCYLKGMLVEWYYHAHIYTYIYIYIYVLYSHICGTS